MGTFHKNKSALHGITVVVDTKGPKVFVGRCDDEDEQQVVLLDVDVHEDGQGGKTKAEYVQRASKFGAWKQFDHIVIPRAEVASITRLGEVLPEPAAAAPKSEVPAPAKTESDPGKVVNLTASAQAEVKRLVDAENKPGIGLRLGVKGGGCSGFSYKLEFDQKKEGDLAVPFEGFNVYLDRKSVIYLRGITLDHQKGLAGRGFVFNNPNATNTCGCGESFAV
jgi:iron-sulfur cluster assembly protein